MTGPIGFKHGGKEEPKQPFRLERDAKEGEWLSIDSGYFSGIAQYAGMEENQALFSHTLSHEADDKGHIIVETVTDLRIPKEAIRWVLRADEQTRKDYVSRNQPNRSYLGQDVAVILDNGETVEGVVSKAFIGELHLNPFKPYGSEPNAQYVKAEQPLKVDTNKISAIIPKGGLEQKVEDKSE